MIIKIIDAQGDPVRLFGEEGAVQISGRPLSPGGDWRLEATTPAGGSVTFHSGATADDVVSYWKREGWEL
jgi:hypothetical protein